MATKKNGAQEPQGYAEAMSELESLLRELDSTTVDVDALSTKVQRASFLIEWCNQRITAAQLTIDEMVAGFAGEDDGYEDDDPDDDIDEDDE